MNCEIISKIKPEVTSPIPSCRRDKVTSPIPSCRRDKVTSPIPSCRRGDNYRSRACTHSVLPLQGELEGVTRKGNTNI